MSKRAEYQAITDRMRKPRKFIQVMIDARQVGKSTEGKIGLYFGFDLSLPIT